MEFSLPPEVPWPQFLRMLRHPSPPRGWLEAAAELPDLQKRPLLLRWIAQHRKTPEHLRLHLLARLPWRPLAAIAEDPSAHPKARALAVERLQVMWNGMSAGERRSFAYRAPRPLWPMIWKIRNAGVIQAFLQHPRLGWETLAGMIQPPLLPTHMGALARSKWREIQPIAHQVLWAMDRTLEYPEHGLVLGQAAPWIKALTMEERLVAAASLTHPALRRMTRAWALPETEADD
jgi:hypothetical protein